MIFSDTHCHIYSEQFDTDISPIIQKATEANVARFFLPNIDMDYTNRLHDLSEKYPDQMFPMMGLHPCSVKDDYKDQLNQMEELLFNQKPVKYFAVGEIGIDLYWDKSFLEQQKDAFRTQVDWALKLGIPIVIHVRDAFAEIFELMDELYTPELKGVFHCFTGGKEEAEKIISAYPTFKMGIGGVVTFKNSGLDSVVSEIPISRIVLETDSPYLAPHPNRGKRNEPSYLLYIAEKVANIYSVSLEELSVITEKNTNELFNL
ncbi:MAG: TatD family hydrolase [Salibacteraceae bacterium]